MLIVDLKLGRKRTRRAFRRVERLRLRKINSDFRVDGSNIPRTERPRHLIGLEMIIMFKRRELRMLQNQGRKVVNYGLWIKFVRSACRLSRERRRMPGPQRKGNRASWNTSLQRLVKSIILCTKLRSSLDILLMRL